MIKAKNEIQNEGNNSFLRSARSGNLEKVLEYLKGSININTSNVNGLNALHLASKEGHTHIVTELLRRGANVNTTTKKGNTALHIACLGGKEEVVKILVQNGANVNAQSLNGFTPLYMAAQENHDSVVRYLLAHRANQSLSTEDGFTPLAVALQQGHDKVVNVLLENDKKGKIRLPALHIAAKKDDCKAAALLLQTENNPDITSKSGFTALHIASHYGNENIANLLIDKKANVNFTAKHKITPLHVAAKWGKAHMVKLLLSKGAKIDAATEDGLTPLHCASRSGHAGVVELLLDNGAPISAKTKNGLAPLHMSSQGDHIESARTLLVHKAPVDDVTVDYLTALHVTAHCGHVKVAKLLLDYKADVNSRALNGFAPLHIACKKNRIQVVELLLKHGASIEVKTESGLTPLHVASFMGCMNIVIYLIQHGANPDVPTVRGETPLHLAARAKQADIIRILLRNGAKVDARAREQQTPLHVASRLGNVDIVSILLQHGANIDAATKDQYTPLHMAAKEGQEEVASYLLENKASVTATTRKGFTPLHLAAKYGNIKVARLLLAKEVPVDTQGKNGVTPLHVAAHYDHSKVALLLLEKKASPHATAKNGYTPLHIAAKKNQIDIATTLLEYGAKANAESKAGFTPLHLAAQEGNTDMAALLIAYKANVNAKAKNGLTPLHLCAQEDHVNVATVLRNNKCDVDSQTKAGYTPLHVASHFGQLNMIRFLLKNGANVNKATSHGYTPLHQAAQQGHTLIVNQLLENKASPNSTTNQGHTALTIAQRLGYITIAETLKVVTETVTTKTIVTTTKEKYKVTAPETMQETFMSDSEDEAAEADTHEHSMRYLTMDEMKSLGDDSLPIDVTKDERGQDSYILKDISNLDEEVYSPAHYMTTESLMKSIAPDNVDIARAPIVTGPLKWKTFLVSFMVDARGGAMRGCRHSGVRVIIPPRKAAMPMRITCRYLRKDKLIHPPPLMEGEACASRILEVGPTGAKFLGPVIIEVPHFASLKGREREIVIMRSDNGETWREHTLEASEEAVREVLNQSFENGENVSGLDPEFSNDRTTRILTTDFPHYFAIVTRIRQEVHAIGPEGGIVNSTVVPQVQAIFPDRALTKKIKVGLQAQPIPNELVTKLLGNRVAVSPIVTVEPRRRKFHKPITLTIPVPQAATRGMINQYSGDTPTLRLLCSITGGTTKAQWEDVTGSTPLTFVNNCVSFTTTVSARFWLMDCRQLNEATKFATELYQESIYVPFMAKFVIFTKRHDKLEAQLRVFCMTDDKEEKTLENQQNFVETAKSRDVEVLEGKLQYLEFAGNLVPVTKSGEQLALNFHAFQENRLPFSIKIRDPAQEAAGRLAFMKEARKARGDTPQQPICNLNIKLPEEIITENYGLPNGLDKAPQDDLEELSQMDPKLAQMAKDLGNDWVPLATNLNLSFKDIDTIKAKYPGNLQKQAIALLYYWKKRNPAKSNDKSLYEALKAINRIDVARKFYPDMSEPIKSSINGIMNDKEVEDTLREIAKGFTPQRDGSYDEKDIMKDAESMEDSEGESGGAAVKEINFLGDEIEPKVRVKTSETYEVGDDGNRTHTVTEVTIVHDADEPMLQHSSLRDMGKHQGSESWQSGEQDTSQVSVSSLPEDEKSEPTTVTVSSVTTTTTGDNLVSTSGLTNILDDQSGTRVSVEQKEWIKNKDGDITHFIQQKTSSTSTEPKQETNRDQADSTKLTKDITDHTANTTKSTASEVDRFDSKTVSSTSFASSLTQADTPSKSNKDVCDNKKTDTSRAGSEPSISQEISSSKDLIGIDNSAFDGAEIIDARESRLSSTISSSEIKRETLISESINVQPPKQHDSEIRPWVKVTKPTTLIDCTTLSSQAKVHLPTEAKENVIKWETSLLEQEEPKRNLPQSSFKNGRHETSETLKKPMSIQYSSEISDEDLIEHTDESPVKEEELKKDSKGGDLMQAKDDKSDSSLKEDIKIESSQPGRSLLREKETTSTFISKRYSGSSDLSKSPSNSRPTSSDLDAQMGINRETGAVLTPSEYETCITSQTGSTSYQTAPSQDTSFSTAQMSLEKGSPNFSISMDSMSSGNFAEISSEGSETLVPPDFKCTSTSNIQKSDDDDDDDHAKTVLSHVEEHKIELKYDDNDDDENANNVDENGKPISLAQRYVREPFFEGLSRQMKIVTKETFKDEKVNEGITPDYDHSSLSTRSANQDESSLIHIQLPHTFDQEIGDHKSQSENSLSWLSSSLGTVVQADSRSDSIVSSSESSKKNEESAKSSLNLQTENDHSSPNDKSAVSCSSMPVSKQSDVMEVEYCQKQKDRSDDSEVGVEQVETANEQTLATSPQPSSSDYPLDSQNLIDSHLISQSSIGSGPLSEKIRNQLTYDLKREMSILAGESLTSRSDEVQQSEKKSASSIPLAFTNLFNAMDQPSSSSDQLSDANEDRREKSSSSQDAEMLIISGDDVFPDLTSIPEEPCNQEEFDEKAKIKSERDQLIELVKPKRGHSDDGSSTGSSIQEFEKLEAEVRSGMRKGHHGSQDSIESQGSRKSHSGNVSVSSLTEFERLEHECTEAEAIEKAAQAEAARLSEIEEGHESQASESQETISGQEPHDDSDSDDYEKRLSEIDEMIERSESELVKLQTKPKASYLTGISESDDSDESYCKEKPFAKASAPLLGEYGIRTPECSESHGLSSISSSMTESTLSKITDSDDIKSLEDCQICDIRKEKMPGISSIHEQVQDEMSASITSAGGLTLTEGSRVTGPGLSSSLTESMKNKLINEDDPSVWLKSDVMLSSLESSDSTNKHLPHTSSLQSSNGNDKPKYSEDKTCQQLYSKESKSDKDGREEILSHDTQREIIIPVSKESKDEFETKVAAGQTSDKSAASEASGEAEPLIKIKQTIRIEELTKKVSTIPKSSLASEATADPSRSAEESEAKEGEQSQSSVYSRHQEVHQNGKSKEHDNHNEDDRKEIKDCYCLTHELSHDSSHVVSLKKEGKQ